MKYFRCERGAALLELSVVMMIVGILASISIPKVGQMLDEVYVDAEIRSFHSTMHYTQSISRLNQYRAFGLGQPSGFAIRFMELSMNFKNVDPTVLNDYCIRRYESNDLIGDRHKIERGFTFNASSPLTSSHMFSADGNFSPARSGTIFLRKGTLRRSLVLNGYGRIRIDK